MPFLLARICQNAAIHLILSVSLSLSLCLCAALSAHICFSLPCFSRPLLLLFSLPLSFSLPLLLPVSFSSLFLDVFYLCFSLCLVLCLVFPFSVSFSCIPSCAWSLGAMVRSVFIMLVRLLLWWGVSALQTCSSLELVVVLPRDSSLRHRAQLAAVSSTRLLCVEIDGEK